MADISHKLLRTNTVLDIMYDMYNKVSGRDFHALCTKKLVGEIVLTRWVLLFLVYLDTGHESVTFYMVYLPFHGGGEIFTRRRHASKYDNLTRIVHSNWSRLNMKIIFGRVGDVPKF